MSSSRFEIPRVKTLIVSPHCDDEVLGCSSFLLEGEVTILYMTMGHALFGSDVIFRERERMLRTLKMLTRKPVPKIVTSIYHQNLNAFDVVPLVKLLNEFEQFIRMFHPTTVVLPNPSHNQDHRAVYEAFLTAVRPHDRIPFVKRVLLYEEPETHCTLRKVEPFKPTYFKSVDIEKKLGLYSKYKSQQRSYRSTEIIRALAKLRGLQGGVDFAEGFEVVRWVD